MSELAVPWKNITEFWTILAYLALMVGVPVMFMVAVAGFFFAIAAPEPPPLCFDVVRTVNIFDTCPDSTHNASVQGAYVVCSCPR